MINVITQSRPLVEKGTIIAQIATFTGSQRIDKVSINLTVNNLNQRDIIIGENGEVSWSAANFYSSRDAWVFHPALHWISSKNWETSGLSIENKLQNQFYSSSTDAGFNAPYLNYKIYLDTPGVYTLWGYGYTNGGIYWSFDNNTTNMRKMILGDSSGPPQWTNFGSFFSSEGGIHDFTVYLSDATIVVLDQWFFTQNNTDIAAYPFTPLPVSKSPFTTGLRLRSLDNEMLDDLETPNSGAESSVSWLPSNIISASGKQNYEIRNNESEHGVTFIDGVSLELFQIGGDSGFFASWDFVNTDNSIGNSLISTDFGRLWL